jgi:hypothetical protein
MENRPKDEDVYSHYYCLQGKYLWQQKDQSQQPIANPLPCLHLQLTFAQQPPNISPIMTDMLNHAGTVVWTTALTMLPLRPPEVDVAGSGAGFSARRREIFSLLFEAQPLAVPRLSPDPLVASTSPSRCMPEVPCMSGEFI